MSTDRTRQVDHAVTMTEFIDSARGAVRVSGQITAQGADLLRGTVEALHRSGHVRVVLDLQDVLAADDAGLHVLRDVQRSLAADGGELLLRPPVG
jgi:anti-anti-sigma regulatory factor